MEKTRTGVQEPGGTLGKTKMSSIMNSEEFCELTDFLNTTRVLVLSGLSTEIVARKLKKIMAAGGPAEKVAVLPLSEEDEERRLMALEEIAVIQRQVDAGSFFNWQTWKREMKLVEGHLVESESISLNRQQWADIDRRLNLLQEQVDQFAFHEDKNDKETRLMDCRTKLFQSSSTESGYDLCDGGLGSGAKLPKPFFNGKGSFDQFLEEFDLFIKTKKLENSQTGKISWLKSCLNGAPLSLVSHGANYNEALERLINHYRRHGESAQELTSLLQGQPVLRDNEPEKTSRYLEDVASIIKTCRRKDELQLVASSATIQSLIRPLPARYRALVLEEAEQESDFQKKLTRISGCVSKWSRILIEEGRALRSHGGAGPGTGSGAGGFSSSQQFQKKDKYRSCSISVSTVDKCMFCKNDSHFSSKCKTWLDMNVQKKFEFVENKNLCKICLRANCSEDKCKLKNIFKKCSLCNTVHALKLCSKLMESKIVAKVNFDSANINLLPTTLIQVNGCHLSTLIDTGSNVNLIKNSVAKSLNLKCQTRPVVLKGINKEVFESKNFYCVPITTVDGGVVDLEFLGCEEIGRVNQGVAKSKIRELLGDSWGDFSVLTGQIDCLLGSPLLKVEKKNLWPTEVKRGRGFRILSSTLSSRPMLHCFSSGPGGEDEVGAVFKVGMENVDDFFSIEALGVTPIKFCSRCQSCCTCKEANKASNLREEQEDVMIRESLKYIKEERRWMATYPKTRDVKLIGNNKNLARKMSLKLEERLIKTGQLDNFNKSFKEQVDRGVFRALDKEEEEWMMDKPVGYVGLTESFKESSSTPVRVCSNSSLKSGGLSLNDCLAKGSNDLSRILHNLLGFREGKIGVTADLKKFYNSVLSSAEDRHLRRVLWRFGDKESEFREFTTESVNFGDVCAGRVASCAIIMTAEKFGEGKEEAVNIIKNKRYVDDIGFTVEKEGEAIKLIKDLEDITRPGGFAFKCFNMTGEEGSLKYLGITWDKKKDVLKVPSEFNFTKRVKGTRAGPSIQADGKLPKDLSKRQVFRLFSGTYDPLGLISPITIKFKLFLRDVVMGEKCWDGKLDQQLVKRAEELMQENFEVGEIEFPRDVVANDESVLLVSCDASEVAFGATVHVVTESAGQRTSRLLVAKARVAPIKLNSIPRKELLGCLVGARLKNQVDVAWGKVMPCRAFTDSSSCLGWFQSRSVSPGKWEDTRILEILSLIPSVQWKWIPGIHNIADLLTRNKASLADIEQDSIFQNGPDWMKLPEEEWPTKETFALATVNLVNGEEGDVKADELEAELDPMPILNEDMVDEVTSSVQTPNHAKCGIKLSSSFARTIRVYAKVIKAVKTMRGIAKRGPPAVADLVEAKNLVCSAYQNLSGDWKLKYRSLVPELIKKGKFKLIVARFRGHVSTGLIFESSFKSPIIDHDTDLARLICKDAHEQGHGGVSSSILRSRKIAWITGVRCLMKKITKACPACKRQDPRFGDVGPGELPRALSVPAPVFTHSGLDLFGPLTVKRERRQVKRWILVIICRTTTFVHCEIMLDYSMTEFKKAFIRFAALYPTPRTIRSDRGTQIVGFKNRITQFMSDNNVDWEFSLTGVAHTNGSAEFAVKIVKRQLSLLSRCGRLVEDDLETLLRRSQLIVNTRPIGWKSLEDGGVQAITPYDFLDGGLGRVPKDVEFDMEMPLSDREKIMKKQFDNLWERLRTDFFSRRTLMNRKARPLDIKENDVVAVKELNARRGEWNLGKIARCHYSADGRIRACDVDVSKEGKIKRLLLGVSRISKITDSRRGSV